MNTIFFLFQMIIILYGLSTYNYLQCSSQSGEIPNFYNIPKCSIFGSVFLKIDQRPQTNFDLQKSIISCYQTEDIRNVVKLPHFLLLGSKDVQNNEISYFVKLLKHAIFIRRFLGMRMHDDKNIHLHLEVRVITCRKCNDFYLLFNTIKYMLSTMYAYFRDFSCPISTKMAKIT